MSYDLTPRDLAAISLHLSIGLCKGLPSWLFTHKKVGGDYVETLTGIQQKNCPQGHFHSPEPGNTVSSQGTTVKALGMK
jgi:hypothetical protein